MHGQSRPVEANASTDPQNWHKYVNHEFGFSFWYPSAYQPSTFDISGVNNYRKFLLRLQQPDDSILQFR